MTYGAMDREGLIVALESIEFGNVAVFCMHHRAVKHWQATGPRPPAPQQQR